MPNVLKLGSVSTKSSRIAMLAKQMPDQALHSLSRYMDLDWMQEAFRRTRKNGAAGVDGQSGHQYAEQLEENLLSLIDRAKSGSYRAPPVREVGIPKGNGETRTLGIPTFEDKVLQRAVAMLLEPIYENDFYDFSYGFRPLTSARQAQEDLRNGIHRVNGGWVLDLDIKGFFDNIDHKHIQLMLRERVNDGVVKRLIGKWLQAGVLKDGSIRRSKLGTPQGGVISPILANIFLHEVIDKWWVKEVRPRLWRRTYITRYADDVVMVFSAKWEAEWVFAELTERLKRYGLQPHPNKTKLVCFQKPKKNRPKSETFTYLGFLFYWGRTRKGNWAVKRKTSKKSFSSALSRLNLSMKKWMHLPISTQVRRISSTMRGHFNYFGVKGNFQALSRFRHFLTRLWKKWLSRRSQKGMSWKKFGRVLKRNPLPKARLNLVPQQLKLFANL